MKKIFVFLLLMVVSFALKAQYPIQQNLGGDSTIIYIKGAARTVGGFINGTYTDTSAANLTRIRQYEAAQIFTTNDSAVWIRTVGAKKWVRLGSESGGSGANIYNSDGSLTGNRILSSVGYSLQFTGLSDFLVDDVVGELVLGTSATNRLRISSGFTAFLSLDADSLLMTRLPQSQLLSTDSVLVRTADFKVKTRAVSSIGSTYTAGNGLTLSGSQFKLGGTLDYHTYTDAAGFEYGLTDASLLGFNSYGTLLNSDDSITLIAPNIRFRGITTVSSTTGRKVALIDTATGKVERIDPASLNTNIYNSDGILTGNRVLKGGLNQLRLDSLSYLLINAGYDGAIPNSLLELSDASATLEYKDNNGVLKARIFGGADGGNMYSFTDDGVGGNAIEQVEGEMSMRTFYSGNLTEIAMYADSLSIRPNSGIANIDSLRTWSGISDTTYKKPMTWDTRNGRWEYAANWPQQKISLVFGAGSGADADTTAFTTSAIYGSFYNDADTIVVTSMRSVLQGTSPDVTYKVWYNDSLNVEAGATALVTAGSQVTNTTTGTNVTSFDVTKIPPGVWVWVKTSTVATKPKYFSLTVNGYRK